MNIENCEILSFQEAGFSYVELNASDTRSKKSLKGEVAEALDNKTIVDFIGIDECIRTTHINRALSQIQNEKKMFTPFLSTQYWKSFLSCHNKQISYCFMMDTLFCNWQD